MKDKETQGTLKHNHRYVNNIYDHNTIPLPDTVFSKEKLKRRSKLRQPKHKRIPCSRRIDEGTKKRFPELGTRQQFSHEGSAFFQTPKDKSIERL